MADGIWPHSHCAGGVVLAGQHNQDVRLMPFSYLVLKGEGHVAMVDVGLDPGQDDFAEHLFREDNVQDWQPPEIVLAKIGVKPGAVDTVLLSHAHYDHVTFSVAYTARVS